MKLKELESCLQQVDGFEEPKILLEQYPTSPYIAGEHYTVFVSTVCIFNHKICDIGCVCSVFGLAYLYYSYDSYSCNKLYSDMMVFLSQAIVFSLTELRYDLPASYKFHKKKLVDIQVDFIRFTPT
uniref:Uncharacterized protein n=1 Tax=Cyprinus carpio TaxID=7962 RepID=A0A8C2PLC1_CYPCA